MFFFNQILYLIKKYGYKTLNNSRILFAKLFPSKFSLESYDKDLFLFKFYSTKKRITQKVNRTIYIIWFSTDEMPLNRKKAYNALIDQLQSDKISVTLITFRNVHKYILEDYPLHSSYKNLSFVHQSDYLRCYLMHHYGGGYADIKYYNHNWDRAFDKLDRNTDKDLLGYREVGSKGVANLPGLLGKELRDNYFMLVGNGAFIHMPYTAFTHEWLTEVNNRLDGFSEALEQNPGNHNGSNEGYPVPWSFLLGQIRHPLCVKFNNKLLIDDSVKPDFEKAYR